MTGALTTLFTRLRAILARSAPSWRVAEDSPSQYVLEATPGPATLRAWGDQLRRPRIPVAWVEIRKDYVSYHLMALEQPRLRQGVSRELAGRLKGKTCFNFTPADEPLFGELEQLTTRALTAFRDAGFAAASESA